MTRTEGEQVFFAWYGDYKKVFKWIREFLPVEYVIFNKEGDDYIPFECKYPKKLDKEELLRFICRGELIYHSDYSACTNVVELKTNSCTCGQWVMGDNGGKHSDWCKKGFSSKYENYD